MRTNTRVNALDSRFLEKELLSLLHGEIVTCFPLIGESYKDESITFLKLFLFWSRTWLNKSSVTDAMLNIKLKSDLCQASQKVNESTRLESVLTLKSQLLTTHQKLYFLVLTVLLPWLWVKLKKRVERVFESYLCRESAIFHRPTSHLEHLLVQIRPLLHSIDIFLEFAYLINLMIFLVKPQYRSLAERILKLETTAINESLSQQTSNFDFLRYHLSWEIFTDFLLAVVPVMNVKLLHGLLWRFVRNAKKQRARYMKKERTKPIQRLDDRKTWRQFLRAWVLSPSIGTLWLLQYLRNFKDPTSIPEYVESHESNSSPISQQLHNTEVPVRDHLSTRLFKANMIAKIDKSETSEDSESSLSDAWDFSGLSAWNENPSKYSCAFCHRFPIVLPAHGKCRCRSVVCYVCGISHLATNSYLCSRCGDSITQIYMIGSDDLKKVIQWDD